MSKAYKTFEELEKAFGLNNLIPDENMFIKLLDIQPSKSIARVDLSNAMVEPVALKCECGCDITQGSRHSWYCPKYDKAQYA